MKHSDLLNQLRLAVSDLGGVVLPITVGVFRNIGDRRVVKIGIPGSSDLLACIGGRFVEIEGKVGRDRRRPEQAKFQAAVEAAGGVYVLARDVEDLRRAL